MANRQDESVYIRYTYWIAETAICGPATGGTPKTITVP